MSDEREPVVEPIVVPGVLAGERVDRAVALLTGWSRADVQSLLEHDDVLVNGRPVAKSHRLAEGDVVEVEGEPAAAALPEPDADVVVPIVFEDDDVLVVDKPAGLVVHPGAGHAGGTMVNGLLAYAPELASVGDPTRPGIVHRLDRDTSGLLVVARTARAYESLVAQLAARSVSREYVALAWGFFDAPRGVIDAPIGRSESRRTRMAVRDEGRPARTYYEVRATFDQPKVSLLDCSLETGRTHQVRVHLAAVGHSVVGDGTYGGARQSIVIDRPFLHAAALAFDHPATGERVRFTSALPRDLQRVLDELLAATT
jgi:23S rRNA pseudouridine1911/1915/1917 synthase